MRADVRREAGGAEADRHRVDQLAAEEDLHPLRGAVGLRHPRVVDVDGLGAVGLAVGAAAEVHPVHGGLQRDRRARGPVRRRPVVGLGVRQPVPAARLRRSRGDRQRPLRRGPVADSMVELDDQRLAHADGGLRRRRDERRECLDGGGKRGHREVLVDRRAVRARGVDPDRVARRVGERLGGRPGAAVGGQLARDGGAARLVGDRHLLRGALRDVHDERRGRV